MEFEKLKQQLEAQCSSELGTKQRAYINHCLSQGVAPEYGVFRHEMARAFCNDQSPTDHAILMCNSSFCTAEWFTMRMGLPENSLGILREAGILTKQGDISGHHRLTTLEEFLAHPSRKTIAEKPARVSFGQYLMLAVDRARNLGSKTTISTIPVT